MATRVARAMWNVGNKSVFIPATTDAQVGLAKGLERATAAIAKAPVHEWRRNEKSDEPTSLWVVAGEPIRGGGLSEAARGSGALDKHLELEMAMAASQKKLAAGAGAGDGDVSDSSAYDDSSSSSSSSGRKKSAKSKSKKSSKKKDKKKDDKGKKRKREKDAKKRKGKDAKKRRKNRKRGSDSDSDSESSDSGERDFVSGEKIKMKLEGANKDDDRKRREYLHQLNATVDLTVLERGEY